MEIHLPFPNRADFFFVKAIGSYSNYQKITKKNWPSPNYRYADPPTPLLPHHKWPYLYEICAMCWNDWKTIFWFYFLRYGRFCSQNSIFLKKNLFFHPKRCSMFWNECRTEFEIFPIFCFWDIVNFVLKIPSGDLNDSASTVWEPDLESLTSDTR